MAIARTQRARTHGAMPERHLRLGRWVALCAAAEAIGMTASAAAAQTSDAASNPALSLGLIVLGGVVEGLALGLLQSRGLAAWLPGLSRTYWVTGTVLVAGVGWAAASAPSQLGGPAGAPPALHWVLLGALGLGAAMGAVLGALQSIALSSVTEHPRRWMGISALAWAPAMAVIFAGATAPDATWPAPLVIVVGTATGAVAGAVLGLVSGILSPWLVGHSVVNTVVLAVLQSPVSPLAERSLVGLRLRGRRSGRVVELPVQYARVDGEIVIFPSAAGRKTWWRNLSQPADIELLHLGRWHTSRARLVYFNEAAWRDYKQAYETRWPRITVPNNNPLVVVELPASS